MSVKLERLVTYTALGFFLVIFWIAVFRGIARLYGG